MLRILLPIAAMLASCTPAPQKAAMPSPSHDLGTPAQAAPASLADSPAEALGRRILSTAFVRVGPDGHMTVELQGGRVLVLRNVVMRPKDYCGVQIDGDRASTKYCGGYAEVAAARPGGGPAIGQPDIAASTAAEPARGPSKRK